MQQIKKLKNKILASDQGRSAKERLRGKAKEGDRRRTHSLLQLLHDGLVDLRGNRVGGRQDAITTGVIELLDGIDGERVVGKLLMDRFPVDGGVLYLHQWRERSILDLSKLATEGGELVEALLSAGLDSPERVAENLQRSSGHFSLSKKQLAVGIRSQTTSASALEVEEARGRRAALSPLEVEHNCRVGISLKFWRHFCPPSSQQMRPSMGTD